MTQLKPRTLLSGTVRQAKALPAGSKFKLAGAILSVSLPRCEFENSTSGKTRAVANTGGFKSLGVKFQGHDLVGSVTAYSYEEADKSKAQPNVEFDMELHAPTESKKLAETGKGMMMVGSYSGEHPDYKINGKPIRMTVNIGYYPKK